MKWYVTNPILFVLGGVCLGIAISQTWMQPKPVLAEVVRPEPVIAETNRFTVKCVNPDVFSGTPTLYLITDQKRDLEILYLYQGNAAAAVKLGE